jgi:hypothetical protein
MEKGLVGMLKKLQSNLEKITEKNGKKIRYIKEISELIEMYSKLEIPEQYSKEYSELLKKGSELNEGDNFRNIKKMDKFLPNCFYLYYSIIGELDTTMNKMMYSFLITGILFILSSIPLYPFWLTAIFIPTMLIGVLGLRKRTSRGLVIGKVLIDFSTFTGFFGLVSVLAGMSNYNGFLNGLLSHYKSAGVSFTKTTMTIFIIVYAFIEIGLIVVSLFNSKYYKKYRKIFL